MSLYFVLVLWAASPEVASCSNDVRTEVILFEVKGRNVDRVVEELTSRKRTFPAQSYGSVGWFDYAWQAKIQINGTGRVQSACAKVNYTILLPTFSDARMKTCFSSLSDTIRRHEHQHVRVTEEAIEAKLATLKGMTIPDAHKALERLDQDIEDANLGFHASAEGRVMDVADFPDSKCGLRF